MATRSGEVELRFSGGRIDRMARLGIAHATDGGVMIQPRSGRRAGGGRVQLFPIVPVPACA